LKLQEFIDYCASRKGSIKEFPFDSHTLVFKVMNKMFALVNLNDHPHKANLKCDPVYALSLRQNYKAVTAGYHMNKKHWNTVALISDAPAEDIKKWVDDSYNLVIKNLSRAEAPLKGRSAAIRIVPLEGLVSSDFKAPAFTM